MPIRSAALLDVNLSGGNAFGIADRLAAEDIPFAFLTGHSRNVLPAAHSARPLLAKPYRHKSLVQDLLRLRP